MSLVTIDTKRCTTCGACVAVCPIGILRMEPDSSVPTVVEWGEKACISCGHCVAVCPTGAFSHQAMASASCAPLPASWKPSPEAIEYFLKGRRSIRTYTGKAVERATLERLIDIARYAPSGINRQPVSWAAISGPAKVRGLAELVIDWMRSLIKESSPLAGALHMENLAAAWEGGSDQICRSAPHVILTYGLKDDMIAPAACTIALTYLELAAVPFGLGACWAGYVQMAVNASPEVRRSVGISSRAQCFGSMLIGYPRFDYRRIPARNKPHIIWRG